VISAAQTIMPHPRLATHEVRGTICSEPRLQAWHFERDLSMTCQRRSLLVSLLVVWVGMVPACSQTGNDGKGNKQKPPGGIGPCQTRPTPQFGGGLRPGNYPVGPLAKGDEAPPLEALGWLNGPCPALGTDGPKVIVVDLWALW